MVNQIALVVYILALILIGAHNLNNYFKAPLERRSFLDLAFGVTITIFAIVIIFKEVN